jgi:hypothetical protein
MILHNAHHLISTGRGGRFPRERDDRHTKGPAAYVCLDQT